MTRRLLLGAMFVAAAILGSSCTCTKEKCKSDNPDLIDKTPEACLAAFSGTLVKHVEPTPGPKIIVKKVASIGGDILEWTRETTTLSVDSSWSVWTGAEHSIPKDLIGLSVNTFDVTDKDSNLLSDAAIITFKTKLNTDTYTFVGYRGPGDQMRWNVKKNTMAVQTLVEDTMASRDNKIPVEFGYLLEAGSFRELSLQVELKEVTKLVNNE